MFDTNAWVCPHLHTKFPATSSLLDVFRSPKKIRTGVFFLAWEQTEQGSLFCRFVSAMVTSLFSVCSLEHAVAGSTGTVLATARGRGSSVRTRRRVGGCGLGVELNYQKSPNKRNVSYTFGGEVAASQQATCLVVVSRS